MKKQLIVLMLVLFILSCREEEQKADAYGNFETRTTTVSSTGKGKLLFLNISEGDEVQKGHLVALVDTVQLDLQRQLLIAQLSAISNKTTDPNPDIGVYQKQKLNLVRERDRLKKLVLAKAATVKQLDDVEGQIVVIDQQIEAAKNKSTTINRGILSEKDPIRAQINLINQQVEDCYIYNPINGMVINQFSESSEIVNFGTPLYTIADLSLLTLRAYAEASSMEDLKIGDEVTVMVDDGKEHLRTIQGKVSWISDEAEFTPKTIQTKEERVNLVYALKIEVPNDGRLKIGMPAEIMFSSNYSPGIKPSE